LVRAVFIRIAANVNDDPLPCEIVGKWASRNHPYFLYKAINKMIGMPTPQQQVTGGSGGGSIGSDPFGWQDEDGVWHAGMTITAQPDPLDITMTGYSTTWLSLRSTTRIVQQNPVSPEELARVRADVEKAINAKNCADFLKSLLEEVKTQTEIPYRDIMWTFDHTKFSYGDAGVGHGGYATGWIETDTAAAVIKPFESNFISKDRSSFIRTQTAQNFLGETLHHVGMHEAYTDGVYANALNAILVRQGKDKPQTFSDKNQWEIDRASGYWHPRVMGACSMRYQ
jgi:hypothetical protein